MERLSESGFKSFFEEYHHKCFLFVKSYVHDDRAAEDIASEALIKMWELSREQDIENPRALLFTILKNKSLDHIKHEETRQMVHAALADYSRRELEMRISTLEACEPETIFGADVRKIIDETLSGMPDRTRMVFEMNYLQHLSKKEIADGFGISVKGVDYHLSNALEKLRANLKDYWPMVLFLLF
jgi:RNA polymerase sigma-70 factor (ECF subfamily)